MHFGITAHLNVEMVAGLSADEGDQVTGITKLSKGAMSAGQIAAQRHHAPNAGRLELCQLGAYAVTAGADA